MDMDNNVVLKCEGKKVELGVDEGIGGINGDGKNKEKFKNNNNNNSCKIEITYKFNKIKNFMNNWQ